MSQLQRNAITVIFLVSVVLVCSMECDGETVIRCIETEREALLEFKEGLIDIFDLLSPWGRENDCCEWLGIGCSDTDGHVIEISLVHYFLGGEIGSSLLKLHNLIYLDLSENDFGGKQFPKFICSMFQLQFLNLAMSNFSGTLPSEIGNLASLHTLDLSQNEFSGTLPADIGNHTNLDELYLSDNNFSGIVPPQLWSLTNLKVLDFSENYLTSSPTDTLLNMTANHVTPSLRTLDLQNNKMKRLPSCIWQSSMLEELRLSSNSLEGTIIEADLAKLHNLKVLDLSFNSLTLDIKPDWTPPFQLREIRVSECKMGPHFPLWLQTNTSFQNIDLSNSGISGEVPKWFWSWSREVYYLNLSNNQLSGSFSDFSSTNIIVFDVSKNMFSGHIPLPSSSYTEILQFSQNMFSGPLSNMCSVHYENLRVLDLSNNQLEGKLPNCWKEMTKLLSLNLGNNNFSGEIPHVLGHLSDLNFLNLANNNFSGELPSTLNKHTLQVIDIGGNTVTGSIPTWIGEYDKIMYLILRNNRFHGSIPPQICHLSSIQALDLSGNNISGKIPPCFNNFTHLVKNIPSGITPVILDKWYQQKNSVEYATATLLWKRTESEYRRNLEFLTLIDLSQNRLVGHIPSSFSSLKELHSLNLSGNRLTGIIDPGIGQMHSLESLDLSSNQISGKIPAGIAKLNFLSVLDFSNNSLSGKIPTGSQLQLFNASAYAGNNGLCGSPLKTCPSTSNEARNFDEEEDGGIFSLPFSKELCISIILGFIFGFWGFVGPLIVMKSWRRTFYNFFGACEDWLFVRVVIFWRKLRRSS